jgi:hypothetical protein
VARDLRVDTGERIRHTAHLAPGPGGGAQRARSNEEVVAAMVADLHGLTEGIAHLHAKDGAVADMGGFEAIANSVAMRSWNHAQRRGGERHAAYCGW